MNGAVFAGEFGNDSSHGVGEGTAHGVGRLIAQVPARENEGIHENQSEVRIGGAAGIEDRAVVAFEAFRHDSFLGVSEASPDIVRADEDCQHIWL